MFELRSTLEPRLTGLATAIDEDTVTLADVYTGETSQLSEIDAVVLLIT